MRQNGYKYLLLISLFFVQKNIVIAGTDTAIMNVTTNAVDSCIITPPENLNFGSISIQSNFPIHALYEIDVICTNGTTYEITHDGGNFSNGPDESRMFNNSSYIKYHITKVNDFSNWPKETSLDGVNTGTGVIVPHPAAITISNASYLDNVTLPGTTHSDTVIFTVTF